MYPSIESSVSDIVTANWNITNGTVVPETDDIVMKNGGRLVEATYAYADLADSSTIAQYLNKEVAATIIRAFVNSATRIFRNFDGEIRSFDGDRVMAIFIGEKKNWNAVRAAYAIEWAVTEVIRPKLKSHWDWSDTPKKLYEISHRVGIDTGESLIVRGGARDNSDLISVGGAPNIAAKLSDLKSGYSTYITDRVLDDIDDEALLYVSSNGRKEKCFTKLLRPVEIGGTYNTVYGSNVYWGL
ncbi:adenylate/guanylate cyclase domain-containing protein [Rhodococcus erythropolis]|uniref:adenylate/guanylate cyclase domain-containing protein n=1 Tax=Rhodococcus erythropolis TaxID=1833 RepID=UPI003013D337